MDRVRRQIGLEDMESKVTAIRNGGQGVVVAVLDTGAADHPDIRNRIVYFKDFVGSRREMYDDNSHGTHICGILGGDGSLSRGKYRGIAPGVSLVVCKVLDAKGEGSAETMLQAMDFVRRYRKQLDIRILNISVGIGQLKDAQVLEKLGKLAEELWEEGVVVVCAAGNKGPGEGSISAVSNSCKVIAVGCHDGEYFREEKSRCELHSGRGYRFSAIRKPDIVAPGTRISSCSSMWHGYGEAELAAYVGKSGTSMATPIVSGCAALLLEREPWLRPSQVRDRLLYSAQDMGEPWNKQGWGMINAKRLLIGY